MLAYTSKIWLLEFIVNKKSNEIQSITLTVRVYKSMVLAYDLWYWAEFYYQKHILMFYIKNTCFKLIWYFSFFFYWTSITSLVHAKCHSFIKIWNYILNMIWCNWKKLQNVSKCLESIDNIISKDKTNNL